MKSTASAVISGRQLFKVLTITLHKARRMIEADSESGSLELALQKKPGGEVV